jgi:hypothetical protein
MVSFTAVLSRRRRGAAPPRLPGMIAAAVLVLCGSAAACPICVERPEATLAERLLDARTAVIAREDPAQPFRFAPVETLKGAPRDAAIPFLLDSATRRRLAARPGDGLLFVHDGQEWRRAAYLDPAMRRTVDAILDRGPGWAADETARFAFFAGLLHDEHPNLRRLAIDELSRARYGLIRAMARPVDPDAARRALADRTELPWAGFHIVMLGLGGRPADRALILGRIAMAARLGGARNLDAWATALIEIDGAEGVARLAAEWFTAPSRPDELRAIIAALAVHGREGDPALRPAILSALRGLPARHPDVAGSVAAALGRIGDFSQADAIERVLLDAARRHGAELDAAELMAAALYVNTARQAAGPAPKPHGAFR